MLAETLHGAEPTFAGFLFRLRAAEANRRHTTAGTLVGSVLLRCLHLDSDAVERLS